MEAFARIELGSISRNILFADFIFNSVHYSFITWKNTFELEIGGKKGTAIVSSLPKWGHQKIIFYKRAFPSGIPKVTKKIFKIENSWLDECKFFIKLCLEKKFNCNKEGLESMIMLYKLKKF